MRADVLIYRTPGGLARGEGSELLLLDLPYRDLGALLADAGDRRGAMLRLREAPVRQRVPVSGADLLAPVAAPGQLVLVGANYADHVAEAGMPTPEAPVFLLVPDTGLAGPMDDIRLPREAPSQVDYEGELAVVLAARGSDIPVARGWEHIAGLTVVNDVSARDVQLSAMRAGTIHDVETLARAKSFPTFKPLGPAALMADDLAEQPDLQLQTFVNGQVRQQGRTSEMLFDLAEIIAYVSSRMELRAGDVLLTGTPSGVGLADGHYLAAGDRVEVRVEGIGSLHNTVIA